MRTLLVYCLALAAVVTGAVFAFPDWFGGTTEAANGAGNGRTATAAPVVVTEVAEAPFADSLEALGTVVANESVEITANRADHIEKIWFDDGQEVEAGQLLVEMNATEEQALLAAAAALRDDARVNFDRVTEMHTQKLVSDRELDDAKTTLAESEARVLSLEAAIEDRQVRAPFAGVLGLRRVSIGAYLQPSTVITTLDDLSVVKLDFTIPETWLPAVRVGMSIHATSDAWLGESFAGEVRTIDTRLDPSSRSAVARALLPNPDHKLRPGMLLKVRVERGEAPVLQVPEEALIPIAEEHFVWRVGADDKVERVSVEVGRRRPGRAEILGGLTPGDRVIVEGIVRVRPGQAVVVVATRSIESS